jgi:hypothetical protein
MKNPTASSRGSVKLIAVILKGEQTSMEEKIVLTGIARSKGKVKAEAMVFRKILVLPYLLLLITQFVPHQKPLIVM